MADVNLDTAKELNITCRKGDTFDLDLDIQDSLSNPKDLTGYSFIIEVRPSAVEDPILTFSGNDFSADASGNLLINKSATDMIIEAGSYIYDMQATLNSNNSVKTWLFGSFNIIEDITD